MDAEPSDWRSDGDELNVAGAQAEIALREEAALAVDKNVAGVNGFQPLRDQRHQPVVVQAMRMEEGPVTVEQCADRLLAIDHDLGL